MTGLCDAQQLATTSITTVHRDTAVIMARFLYHLNTYIYPIQKAEQRSRLCMSQRLNNFSHLCQNEPAI